jgi:ribose 5-phosphate isomerase A
LSTTKDDLKKRAAEYAVDTYARSNSVIGLGVGSTATHAIRRLAEHLQTGRLENIVGIACSERTATDAQAHKIPLSSLDEYPNIDVTFDGADEVDPALNLIKGGGGALLREKIVAQASQQEIIMIDDSKLVPVLGTGWALPIEVMPFGLVAHQNFLRKIGGEPILRMAADQSPYCTDQGNYILDTDFGAIENPQALADLLKSHAGIVEHGLFVGLVSVVVVAGVDGIRVLTPPPA